MLVCKNALARHLQSSIHGHNPVLSNGIRYLSPKSDEALHRFLEWGYLGWY